MGKKFPTKERRIVEVHEIKRTILFSNVIWILNFHSVNSNCPHLLVEIIQTE